MKGVVIRNSVRLGHEQASTVRRAVLRVGLNAKWRTHWGAHASFVRLPASEERPSNRGRALAANLRAMILRFTRLEPDTEEFPALGRRYYRVE